VSSRPLGTATLVKWWPEGLELVARGRGMGAMPYGGAWGRSLGSRANWVRVRSVWVVLYASVKILV
jgi:hypothetical protein